MALHAFFAYGSGQSLVYSVEQIATGLFFDFGSLAFVASPTTLTATLPEGSGPSAGEYTAKIASTPVATWVNGDYLVRIHDSNRASIVIGLAPATMYGGDDGAYFGGGGGSGVDPLTETVPGSYAAGTAGAAVGQIPTIAGETSAIQTQLATVAGEVTTIQTTVLSLVPAAAGVIQPIAIVVPSGDLQQPLGTDRTYSLTLFDGYGNLVTTFQYGDSLAATLWAGDDQIPLASPSVTWTSPALGTIALTVAAANSAGLSVGTYPVRVTIRPQGSGQTLLAWQGRIRFTYSPAAATSRPVYSQYIDLLKLAPWIESIQEERNDQATFANERADARAWFDERILSNFRGNYIGMYGAHSEALFEFWGGGGQRRTRLTNRWLKGYLDSNLLIVTNQVGRVNAYYALAQICLGQVHNAAKYAALAQMFTFKYEEELLSTRAEIDQDGDGWGEIVITFTASNNNYT